MLPKRIIYTFVAMWPFCTLSDGQTPQTCQCCGRLILEDPYNTARSPRNGTYPGVNNSATGMQGATNEVDPPTAGSGAAYSRAGTAQINHDGSPTAYNPSNTGTDNIRNAGRPGKWYGIATDSKGNPIVDPKTGYYVSTTSLTTGGKASSQSTYFNSDKTPGVAISNADKANGVKLGDKVLITNTATGQTTWGYAFDSSGNRPSNHTEIGTAAARNIGIGYNRSGTTGGGSQIRIDFYPNTADGKWKNSQ